MLHRNLCFKQFYDNKPIIFYDKEVEKICIEKYDANHNGYVTQNELDIIQVIPRNIFNTAKIKSLRDIINFTNVNTIQSFAFSDCTKCTDIIFPKNIQLIQHWVTMNSPNINTVIFLGTTPPYIINNFMRYNTNYNIPKDLKIYVPDNAVQAYKEKWKSIIGNYIDDILPLIKPISEYHGDILI